MQECKILGRIPASSSSLVLLSQTCRNAELYEHEMATCLRRSTDLLILFINIWMAGKMQWHYEIIDNCYVFSLPISAHCNLSGSEVYWGEKELRESGSACPDSFIQWIMPTSAVTTNIDLINESSAKTNSCSTWYFGTPEYKDWYICVWAPDTEHVMLSHFIQNHALLFHLLTLARVQWVHVLFILQSVLGIYINKYQ